MKCRVEFQLGVKPNDAAQEVRAKVSGIRRDLPRDIEEPIILKQDPAALPVVSIAVRSSTLAPREVTELVDKKVRQRLENVPGVGKAGLIGGAWREVSVDIDPARLEALGLGIDEVVGGLQSENVDVPVGRLKKGSAEYLIRVQESPWEVEGFEKMVIGRRKDLPIRLDDVAEVSDGTEEQRSLALPRLVATAASVRTRDDIQAKFIPEFSARQNGLSAQIEISQVIFSWGQVGAAIRAARIAENASDDQLRIHHQAVALDVSVAFFDILLARELNIIAGQNVDLKQRHLEEAQRKLRTGTATDYDVVAAQVAVENARPELIRTGNLVRMLRERLAFLLGDGRAQFDVVGSLAMERRPVPAFDEIMRAAYENRPEVAELAHKRDIALELVKVARAAGKPRLDFLAQIGRRSLSAGSLGVAGNSWNAGLFLTFPFFDGFRTRAQGDRGAERRTHG